MNELLRQLRLQSSQCLTRRKVLVYRRYGVVRPVFLPPYGAMMFDAAAIHALRRAERLRRAWQLSPPATRLMLDLLAEVERLRTELDFWRGR